MRKNPVKIFSLNQEVFIIKDNEIITDFVEGANSYPAEKKIYRIYYKLKNNGWFDQDNIFYDRLEAEEKLYELQLKKDGKI